MTRRSDVALYECRDDRGGIRCGLRLRRNRVFSPALSTRPLCYGDFSGYSTDGGKTRARFAALPNGTGEQGGMIALADPQNITDVLGQGQALYCDLGWTDLVRNEPAAFPRPAVPCRTVSPRIAQLPPIAMRRGCGAPSSLL